MTIDFELLSMSELRNGPGEILDRVAHGGEAFIIERNGRRTACLVPLSLFFPDVSPARIADEINELTEQGEVPSITINEARELKFIFKERLSDDSEVSLEILLPHGYPHNCPRVYTSIGGDGVPHRWRDGALCLYGVMTGWNPGKHTVFFTLQLTRKWLQHYAEWCTTGKWPRQEA